MNKVFTKLHTVNERERAGSMANRPRAFACHQARLRDHGRGLAASELGQLGRFERHLDERRERVLRVRALLGDIRLVLLDVHAHGGAGGAGAERRKMKRLPSEKTKRTPCLDATEPSMGSVYSKSSA